MYNLPNLNCQINVPFLCTRREYLSNIIFKCDYETTRLSIFNSLTYLCTHMKYIYYIKVCIIFTTLSFRFLFSFHVSGVSICLFILTNIIIYGLHNIQIVFNTLKVVFFAKIMDRDTKNKFSTT